MPQRLKRGTSPNSRLCRRVVERRRRVGSVCVILFGYFRASLSTFLSFVRALSVSTSSHISASPGSFHQGARTLGRSAVRTRSPSTPSPHCGATSAGRYPPAVAHISAPLSLAPNPPRLGPGGPEDFIYPLTVLPARLACADARFEQFASGRATALLSRGGQHSRCAFFKVLSYLDDSSCFRSPKGILSVD